MILVFSTHFSFPSRKEVSENIAGEKLFKGNLRPGHILMQFCTVDLRTKFPKKLFLAMLKTVHFPCFIFGKINIQLWPFLIIILGHMQIRTTDICISLRYLHFTRSCQYSWQIHKNESTLLHKGYLNRKQTMIKTLNVNPRTSLH